MSKYTLDDSIKKGGFGSFDKEKEQVKRMFPCNASNVPESKKKLEGPIGTTTSGNKQMGFFCNLRVEKETDSLSEMSLMGRKESGMETPKRYNANSSSLRREGTLPSHKDDDVSMSRESSYLSTTPKSSIPRSVEHNYSPFVSGSPLGISSGIVGDSMAQGKEDKQKKKIFYLKPEENKEKLLGQEKKLTEIIKKFNETDKILKFESIRKSAFEREDSRIKLADIALRETPNRNKENDQLKENDCVGRITLWRNNEARIGFEPLNKEQTIPDIVHSTNWKPYPIHTNWWSDYFPRKIEVKKQLKEKFGHTTFKLFQYPVIKSILAGYNVLVLMPTGGGKSLCYQLPSLLKEGYTIVVSPLISLMQDQVNKLNKIGIPAITCNSKCPENLKKLENDIDSEKREIKMVYVSPECIDPKREYFYKFRDLFDSINEKGLFSLLVIDEAHCISQWGHDFRPSYENLYYVRARCPSVQTIMFTATATERVRDDILLTLGIEESFLFNQTFNRSNLFFEVKPKTERVKHNISLFIKNQNHSCGIIFCLKTKDCELLSRFLRSNRIESAFYHGKLSGQARKDVLKSWMKGTFEVVCATVAFGMGIDKPDVRYVIHYTMPSSIEQYYQEVGRAGRDSKPSKCILYYSPGDIQNIKSLKCSKKNKDKTPLTESQKKSIEKSIISMSRFCESKSCRRQFLLKHFNECFNEECGRCDNCKRKQGK